MKRESLKNQFGVPYLKYTPEDGIIKGTILWFSGSGERGTDVNRLENTEIPKLLKYGLNVPYIVVAPLIPSNSGFWGNIVNPFIELCKSFGYDLHSASLSLGSIDIFPVLNSQSGTFKTLATAAGRVDNKDLYKEVAKIPSIHAYDPRDGQVAYGYASIKEMVTILKGNGADIELAEFPGTGHASWVPFYKDVYWKWLESKIEKQPAPVSDPVVKTELINGKLVFTSESGKQVTITP